MASFALTDTRCGVAIQASTGDSPAAGPLTKGGREWPGENREGSVKPTFIEGPCVEDSLKLLKSSSVQKVGNLKAELTVSRSHDVENLLRVDRI